MNSIGRFISMSKKLSVTPSSISFALGDASCSQFHNSCLRYTLVQRNSYAKTSIPALYTALGEIDEHRFQHHLNMLGVSNITKQTKFEVPFKDIIIKGKTDFEGVDGDGAVVIDKKSTSNSSTRSKMRKGEISIDYIAQLVLYMGVKSAKKGYIIQSYYEFDYEATSLSCTEEIKHTILIKNNSIYVNGLVFQYTPTDLRSWLNAANRVLTAPYLASRPLERRACAGCPLNALCDKVEKSKFDHEAFIREGAHLIWSTTQNKDPQVFKPKRAIKALRYQFKKENSK